MDYTPAERSDPDSDALCPQGQLSPKRWNTSPGASRLAPELIRDEVARGRMIIPANIHHTNLEPMCIGVASKCKINANIGNSATTSNIDEELEKLHYAVKYGADTRDGSFDRRRHPAHPQSHHRRIAGADRHGADL